MNISAVCVKRPVLASVISLILIIIGILGYQHLATRFFPDFQAQAINITTTKPAASAEYIERAISTPIEQQLSGISGIDNMQSVSRQGSSSISLNLAQGADYDQVMNNVRAKVSLLQQVLPTGSKIFVSSGFGEMPLFRVAVTNPSMSLDQLQDYVSRNVIKSISQLPGVAKADVFGASPKAMVITFDKAKLAQFHLSLAQIAKSIRDKTGVVSGGSVRTNSLVIPVNIKSKITTAADFKAISIVNHAGKNITLGNIANVAFKGFDQSPAIVKYNGKPAVSIVVFSRTDSNEIAVANEVYKSLKQFGEQVKDKGTRFNIYADMSVFMKNSVHEVYEAIGVSVICVVLVIFIFLGDLRSVIIPVVTIPVCLIASMGVMYLLGYSINMITLIALVLCIGLVVDDAIVVLENIHRHIQAGMGKVEAAIKGSKEITFSIIVMTLTLVAVYAPFGFMSGMAAAFLTPFAFTLAGAVLISGFVSLTLSPMMCSKLLKADTKEKRGYAAWNQRFFTKFSVQYKDLLAVVMRHRWIVILITVLLVALGVWQAATIPKAASPAEDVGFIMVVANSSHNESVTHIQQQLVRAEKIIKLQKNVSSYVSFAKSSSISGPSSAIVLGLKPWGQRHESSQQIAANLNNLFQQQTGLGVRAVAISGAGHGVNGLQFTIYGDLNYTQLNSVSNTIMAKLAKNKNLYDFSVNTSFDSMQYNIVPKLEALSAHDISLQQLENVISIYFAGANVASFNQGGLNYDAYLIAPKSEREQITSIDSYKVVTANNKLVPMQDLINTKLEVARSQLTHFNSQHSATITAQLRAGYSIGEAIKYVNANMPGMLSNNLQYQYLGAARSALDANSATGLLFLLALAFIFLILAAQFESYLDPLIILSSVPLCIVVAIMFLKWTGGSINLYTTVGLITLIGLIAKHGILITQFANQQQQQGSTANSAVVEAAGVRLRPILMTTAAMCMGSLPLMLASGAGANSRHQIGMVIFSGLLGGTFFSLLVVPVVYSYFNQMRAFCCRKFSS